MTGTALLLLVLAGATPAQVPTPGSVPVPPEVRSTLPPGGPVLASTQTEELKEVERFQGTWQVTALEQDGRPAAAAANLRMVVSGTLLRWLVDGKVYSEWDIVPDLSGKVPTLTMTNRTIKYTFDYKFEKGSLVLCQREKGKDEPTGFTTRPGSGTQRVILSRVP